jgi:competence protein ComEC
VKSRLLYIVTFSFFVGIGIASFASFSYTTCLLVIGIGCAFVGATFLLRSSEIPVYFQKLFIGGLVLIFVGVGMFRMNVNDESDELARFVGNKIEYIATVSDEPEMKDITQRFRARITHVDSNSVSQEVLIIGNRYPEYRYGDELRLVGTLRPPENFEVYEGGPIFDYISYLYKDGVRYVMYRPKIEKIGESGGNPVLAFLYSVKRVFSESVENVMNEPESSLVLGLLAGDKSSLGTDILDEFRRAGLSHIIVLSGYNVTIVAESLMKTFSYVSIPLSPFLGVFSIILFALMTGASATTVRASIMALLVIFSKRIARRYDVSRALVFAAFLMVVHNPQILVFDVSFQLSVLATVAIIYIAPLIRNHLTFITERFMLRDVVAATLGTQLFVLPYILHVMGTLSLVSIFSNILVLPIVPVAMFSGFITGIVGLVSSLIAIPLGWISNILLAYILEVTHISASFPFSAINVSVPLFATVILYILFVLFLVRVYKKRSSRRDERSVRIFF